MIQDPRQGVEDSIGATRCTTAALIEPTVHAGACDPVKRQCIEIRQKFGFQSTAHTFPGSGFEKVVTRRLPFFLDKVTEFGHGHFHGLIQSDADLLLQADFKAFAPRIHHHFHADGAKTVAPRPAGGAALIHPGSITRWLDPDAETGGLRVPDRVLGRSRSEPACIGIAQHPPGTNLLVLALHEIAPGSRATHADAETFEFHVAASKVLIWGLRASIRRWVRRILDMIYSRFS